MYINQVYSTTDDGAHWAPYGVSFGSSYIGDTIEVSKSNPHRVYVSAENGGQATMQGVLFTSTTDGMAWTTYPIPLLQANEEAAFIAAVDPTNEQRVYLRTGDKSTGRQPSRLLVTDNAGMSFTTRFTGNAPMQGFALTPDGSKVYIGFGPSLVDGGTPQGLQIASTQDFMFTQRNTDLIQCLALSGSTLYACAPEVNGFIIGASMDDGKSFATLLHLCSVRGPLACGASTTAGMICPMYWTGGTMAAPIGQASQLGVPCSGPPDAGPGDAASPSPDSGAPVTKPKSSSPGCAASSAGATVGWYGLGGVIGLWVALAWRRSSRQRRGRR
jgi:hypothetical protein